RSRSCANRPWRRATRTSTSSPARPPRARSGSTPCRARSTRRSAVASRTEHVMGMPVTITVRGGAPDLDPAFAWLERVDVLFSTYRPQSEIRRIDAGELAPAAADPLVREVLARCDRLRRETGGAFDARAGGALDPSGYVKGWA